MEGRILREKPSLLFIGMPCAGKTTIGREVSKLLGYDFIDFDAVIERRFGMSVGQIFEKMGERYFRRLERELALEYSFRGGLVLSPGGGFVENGFCPEVLRRRALVVHIIRTPDKKSFETRPLLRKEGAYDALKARRWPLYLKYRDFELLNEGSIIEGAENAARIYWENVR